jgi:hypothetical protein
MSILSITGGFVVQNDGMNPTGDQRQSRGMDESPVKGRGEEMAVWPNWRRRRWFSRRHGLGRSKEIEREL